MTKDTPVALFKDIMNIYHDALKSAVAVQETLETLTKKLDTFLKEENWLEAERVRGDVIDAFTSAVDVKIALSRKTADIQRRRKCLGIPE